MRLAPVFSCQPLHTSHFALLLPSKNAKSKKKKNNTATTTECATRATTTSMLVFFLQNGTPMRGRTYKDYCSGKDTPYHALFRRHRLLVCQRKKKKKNNNNQICCATNTSENVGEGEAREVHPR